MELLDQITACMTKLLTETKGMQEGIRPDPVIIEGLQAELVDLYWKLGQDTSKFSVKEKSRLNRKRAVFNSYKRFRNDNMSIGDAREEAFDDNYKANEEEVDRMEEYEAYRNLLSAMDKAIQHSSQVVSLTRV